jgi:hypothetical protein
MISFHTFQLGLLFLLTIAVLAPLPGCWRICQRTGRPGWMSLVIVIPVVNAIAVFLLARSRFTQPVTASLRTVDTTSAIHLPVHHH